MTKQYNKHLFFVSKGLNWDIIPDERKSQYVMSYVLKTSKSIGKVQDWRRYCIQNNISDFSTMLSKAIELNTLV